MPARILVIRFGSLGDLILTSPVILNLKLNYPDAEVVFLTKEEYRPLVDLFGTVDRIVTLPNQSSIIEYDRLLKQLNRESFDLVIDLHGNPRSWLARRRISAKQSFVYPKRIIERRRAVLRWGKRLTDEWPHSIDLYNDVILQSGGRVFCRRPILGEGQQLKRRSQTDRKKVFIAPGAAHPTKSWGMERFIELTRRLQHQHNCQIVWAVTKADQPDPSQLKGLIGPDFSLWVNEPFDSLLSIVAECDLSITNDSGMMHFSSLAGTPTLALFGPTHPLLGFAPRGLFDDIIQTDETCRPCSLHGKKACYREEQFCFDLISPEAVVERALKMFDRAAELTPALFVDRDGTLIVEKDFLSDPDQVELIPGVAEGLKLAVSKGYHLVMITNQSGVARGLFGTAEVERVNSRVKELLAAAGVNLDGVYYCPYHTEGKVPEFTKSSKLRKPEPGMPEKAALELKLDLRRSIVIGDKLDDFLLGRVIGGRGVMVRTGYGRTEAIKGLPHGLIDKKNLFDDLLEAVPAVVTDQL